MNGLNKAVFTTKQVVSGKPIVYVFHDSDDDWQFLGADMIPAKDLMIVALQELLDIDDSINKILWMPPGMEAFRKDVNGEWEMRVRKDEE